MQQQGSINNVWESATYMDSQWENVEFLFPPIPIKPFPFPFPWN